MPFNQVENPPGHARGAPEGEIRNEPRPVLQRFTLVVVIAMILPLLAFAIAGATVDRGVMIIFGICAAIVLAICFAYVLWKIMSSRKNPERRYE